VEVKARVFSKPVLHFLLFCEWHYNAVVVDDYIVDLLVEDVLPVELKTVKALHDAHMPH
jgi:hypothetical protein